ncbi:hypothetical protein SK128_012570, partial [Halocaridina rubra]
KFHWAVAFLALAGVEIGGISWNDNLTILTPPPSLAIKSPYSSYGGQTEGMYGQATRETRSISMLSEHYGVPLVTDFMTPQSESSTFQSRNGLLPEDTNSSGFSNILSQETTAFDPLSSSTLASSFLDEVSTSSPSSPLNDFTNASSNTSPFNSASFSLTTIAEEPVSTSSLQTLTKNSLGYADTSISATEDPVVTTISSIFELNVTLSNITNSDFMSPSTRIPITLPYPTYTSVPRNLNFTCKNRLIGYYADPETECQVWHWCLPGGQHYTFVCPVQTLFNQAFLVCDWWYNVNCSAAGEFYEVNESLYKLPEEKDEN